jgi:hypothetical protein
MMPYVAMPFITGLPGILSRDKAQRVLPLIGGMLPAIGGLIADVGQVVPLFAPFQEGI